MLIFEQSVAGRSARTQISNTKISCDDIPLQYLRNTPLALPEVSELQVVRHYTTLSQKNFSIDTNFYPLGSCTMKYNPRAAHKIASLPDFLARHPFANLQQSQGYLQSMYELQQMLANITGMLEVSLCPMAGAQGEFVGLAMIRAYHLDHGDSGRTEILVPDNAHGTNPASAAMCGFKVREIATDANGDIIIEQLQQALGPQTAGLMLTNPSTLGVFERNILQITKLVHDAGGLLYYDGANLNAILGRVRPGDMGFDVMHLNLHKTFATPHGGGGPGAGPVAANARLAPYLPIPIVGKNENAYLWLTAKQRSKTIGRVSACMGNAGVLLRAYIYIRMLGQSGLREVSAIAVLNANYLMRKLAAIGYTLAFPNRLATHEFIISLTKQSKYNHVNALDFAKRIIDEKIHAPTIYFPLVVPECWLIEPTETETKQTLDQFLSLMQQLFTESEINPQRFKQAPLNLPVRRLDEVKAAKELNVKFSGIL
jgi:glycine dehydrogenase subunit 2